MSDKNDMISCILTRRSIRKYSDEQIDEKLIRQVLEAAMHAPSAVNRQPWHFIVTSNKERLKKIADIHPHASFITGASHAILVCGDEELQHDNGYYVVDCGAATENLLLAAHALGIGSCWIGVHPREERKARFRTLYQLPSHIQPYALIALGYPAEERTVNNRYKEDRVHFDFWQNR